MTTNNADELRALLERAAETGNAPTQKELMTIGLTGPLDERQKARAAISQAAQTMARGGYHDNAGQINNIVGRYAGLGSEDAATMTAAREMPRTVEPWDTKQARRPGDVRSAEPSAVRAITDVLNSSSISGKPVSTDDLARLESSATGNEAAAWRKSVYEASQEVAKIARTGNQRDAWSAARELAGGLVDGLAEPEPAFDPSESARRPDGSYDPVALAAGIPRR